MSDLYLLRGAVFDGMRPRRLIGAAFLVCLPALLCLLGRWILPEEALFNKPDIRYNLIADRIVIGFTLTLLSVVFATGVISLELEQKTIVYLLTRPVPRWRILLMRFLGKLLLVICMCWLSASLLAITAYYPGDMFNEKVLRDLKILPVAALAYGSLFLFMATVTSRPLLLGLVYSFGFEYWAPLLTGQFKKFAIITYIQALAPHPVERPEEAANIAAQPSDPAKVTSSEAWTTLFCVIAVALIASVVAFSKKEYAPREDAE